MTEKSLEERVSMGTRAARFLDKHRGKIYLASALLWTVYNVYRASQFAVEAWQDLNCTRVDDSHFNTKGDLVISHDYRNSGPGATGGKDYVFDHNNFDVRAIQNQYPINSCPVIRGEFQGNKPEDLDWAVYRGESINPTPNKFEDFFGVCAGWVVGLIFAPILIEVARQKIIDFRNRRAG